MPSTAPIGLDPDDQRAPARASQDWLPLALGAGLWLVAFLAALPITTSPVYWDESVHYATARHGSPVDPRFHDLWGNPINSPASLFWQRPAWYALMHFPAQGDLHTFRLVHAALAAGLAPIAYALVRSFGFRRPTGVATGLAVALVPPLPTWTALGFMDPMMAEALGLAVLASRRSRWPTAAACAVLAVWCKETAVLFVAPWTLAILAQGWWRGDVAWSPLRLGRRETAMLYALLVAPLPILYGMVGDVPLPGGVAYHPTQEIADAVFGTPWLLVPLVLGLAWRRSRLPAFLGLATGGALLALQALGRSTESWYMVPSLLFAFVGAAASCEAALAAAWASRRGLRRAGSVALVAGTLVAALCLVALPVAKGREALYPFSERGAPSLPEAIHDETHVRDQDLEAAFRQLPRDGSTLVMIEPHWPPEYVRLADAGPVIMDLAFVRAVIPFDVEALAHAIEGNGTWTMVYDGPHPMQKAVPDVYADCVVGRHGGITLIVAAPCAGRAQRLAASNHAYGGP